MGCTKNCIRFNFQLAEARVDSQSCHLNMRFFSPRYWPTWMGLGVLRLIHLLPYNFQLAIGRVLGKIFRVLVKRREKIARRNLELCFPKLTRTEREKLLTQHFEALGMSLIEGAMSWWGSDKEIQSLAEVTGLKHVSQALKSGRGVVLLTGHLTSMELSGHILGSYINIGAMYRPMKNKLMDKIIKKARSQRLSPLFQRDDIRTMARALKNGHAVWYGFDQNYGKQHSVFVPFFGIPTATITTTSRFAKMGDAIVIPYFPFRTKNGRYLIEIQPPLDNFPSRNLEEDTLRLNAILEEAILKTPEQYLWIHRRFKTRPEGADPVY